jgi:MOSC domain-containing protein YiiM
MNKIMLLSIQVGKPQTYPPDAHSDSAWTSAIVKLPVPGPVEVAESGVNGDAQYDRKHHGGPYQAINVYPSENYERWRLVAGMAGIEGGGFGENFTTRGLLERTTCIGDIYQVGDIVVQVTQPRAPCYKLARRWKVKDLTALAESEGRTGFYLRVLQPGMVTANTEIQLVKRTCPEWSIARVWEAMQGSAQPGDFQFLATCDALSPGWRGHFQKKLDAV